MNPTAYTAFIEEIRGNLEPHPEVLGLVVVGSTANQSHAPDEWSDHDFALITEPGHQARFRYQHDWLPQNSPICLAFQETEHSLKILYEDGHLIEFAVFDPEELNRLMVNDYQVLIDRANITAQMQGLARRGIEQSPQEAYLWGQLITHLLTGINRYRRGEKLSGHHFIKYHAISNFLELYALKTTADKTKLDNLDSFRRYEQVFPEVAAEVNSLLVCEPLETAQGLLQLVEKHLPDYPKGAIDCLRKVIGVV